MEETRVCTKRELLSLILKLAHATKVVMASRTFLRRMIDTSISVKKLHCHIKLTAEFHSDLAWWECFLPTWKTAAASCAYTQRIATNKFHLAVTHLAAGAVGPLGATRWIQCEWQSAWDNKSIALKELLPIVLACTTLGST